MSILGRVFLILGVAFISYGVTRWKIVPDILSKQDEAFQQFIAAYSTEINANFSYPTNLPIKQDFYRLKMRVRLSGDLHPGWPQAAIPCALGVISLVMSYYFSQRKRGVRREPLAK